MESNKIFKGLFLKVGALLVGANLLLIGCYSEPPPNCCFFGYPIEVKYRYPFGLYSTNNFSRAHYHPPTDLYYYDPYVQTQYNNFDVTRY